MGDKLVIESGILIAMGAGFVKRWVTSYQYWDAEDAVLRNNEAIVASMCYTFPV